jgi:chromosome partitioning protein
MKTVAIVAQKGGVGKTTLAIHLATLAELVGLPTVLIDLDPQASASAWKDGREADTPIVTPVPPTRLQQALEAAKEGKAKLAVIDTAPHVEAPALGAIRAADLVLIPTRPGLLDLHGISATAELVKLAGKEASSFVILNNMPVRAPKVAADVIEAVGRYGLKVAPVTLHQRAAFSHSLTDGLTAGEYEPDGKAGAEMAELLRWVCKNLSIKAK